MSETNEVRWRIRQDRETGEADIWVGGKHVTRAKDLNTAIRAARRANLHMRFMDKIQ